ncbi:helix-turn-helix domain-containing protein [Desulfotalea psychrophila]|uniref:Related to 5' to 3' DNA helicase n=1 Tax=Desulfotalea psychrophila (strain LSv54 / DSM 12343) TaxID=177439 RepID=Q6ALQ9_DESPS|nr:helix-turn-helix domain-containing protein [Desulfotalea psychrophila]CAG36716.1 related to 5' to 3' DNA helicase [Desulfotalea psychrophila LSv54]
MSKKNPQLELANEFVEYTDCTIFLTGRAGTGKTTFLKNLAKTSAKRLIIVAPTGVAAINAGGVTMHSFFQLSFAPFVPGGSAQSQNMKYRFSKEKINIIKSLDLLIIDEISMVRADVLDAIDAVLRRYRQSEAPFGGVQLLMIGDLQQLSPVITKNDQSILGEHYKTPYFFGSYALQKTKLAYIELQQIYRQSDISFINLLNKIRENSITEAELAELNKRYNPEILEEGHEDYITLCTHNYRADAINSNKLVGLSAKTYSFAAEIKDDFPEQAYPASLSLELKPGAQVMFLRNDISVDRLFFNGKIGRVIDIDEDGINVLCPGERTPVTVKPVVWEHMEYKLDAESGEIEEKKLGTFSQYPLKLAWAITIHKSQGLSFDRVIVDGEAAFAPGQIYVALSRCRSLEGLVLCSTLRRSAMQTDRTVLQFIEQSEKSFDPLIRLKQEKILYQQKLILVCYHFEQLAGKLRRVTFLLTSNRYIVQISGMKDVEAFETGVTDEICAVGGNFQRQLIDIFKEDILPTDNDHIMERCCKAAGYFCKKIDELLIKPLELLRIESDNSEINKKIAIAQTALLTEALVKKAGIASGKTGFSPRAYLRAISQVEIEQKGRGKKREAKIPAYSEEDIAHPKLFASLRKWRTVKAKEEKIPAFQVLHQSAMVQITVSLPKSDKELLKLKGVGPRTVEKYGEELLSLVREYCGINDIQQMSLPEPKREVASKVKASRGNTKEISLNLFNEGKAIVEIAQLRDLSAATIETHLAFWVKEGKMSIARLVSKERQQEIEVVLLKSADLQLGEIKEQLGKACSYGDIKFTQAHLQREK